MSLKSRLFSKDSRKSSLDLHHNLYYCVEKLCKDHPATLSELKMEYDRFFRDKISLKAPEVIQAAIKSMEDSVIAVKTYVCVDNRETTDLLIGLRDAPYSNRMVDEDIPPVSKQRLLNIIKEHGSLGIHVKDLEERYILIFHAKPSYLPFKSLKEFLHRTPEVEMASSGKSQRVRFRQIAPLPLRRSITKIPSLNRNSFTTSSLRHPRKSNDIMSMSVYKPSELSYSSSMNRKMSSSVHVSSSRASLASGIITPPSSSGSPVGSADLSELMNSFNEVDPKKERELDVEATKKHHREVLSTLLRDIPPEGISLKTLTNEFTNIVGSESQSGTTIVQTLTEEFRDVVKFEDDINRNGLRVYRLNSPLLPRRSVADVYTKLALQSNRKPSDRVLKILRDIYKKKETNATTAPIGSPCETQGQEQPSALKSRYKAIVRELKGKLATGSANEESEDGHGPPDIFEIVRERVKAGPVGYPKEFEELTKEASVDTQTLLVQMMSTLNLCLKPLNGRMVIQAA